jgi:hypothetical protein
VRVLGHVLAGIAFVALAAVCLYGSIRADRSWDARLSDRAIKIMSFGWVRSQEDMVDRLRVVRAGMGIMALVIAAVFLATA